MSHGTEHHLEHAEHSQHAAHNPFDRGVAMTMAIIAAVLAGVTLVSHRGHTETLRLATEATTHHTKASDDWNLYQAKNIRNHEYQAFLFMDAMYAKDVVKQDDEARAMRAYWINQVDKFEGKGYWKAFVGNLGKPRTSESEGVVDKESERFKLSENAVALQTRAKQLEAESHHLHGIVTWIDLGHLGLELALVLCAVAVLTKQRPFLMIGIATAVVGTALAGWGMAAWWMMETAGAVGHH